MSTNAGNQFTGYNYYQQMYPYQAQATRQGTFTQPAQQQGFMQAFPQVPSGVVVQTPGAGVPAPQIPGMLPLEQSYIENILRLNKGKLVTVYMTFEGNKEWNAKVFKGVVEAAGRDHLILSDPQSGFRYLLPMVYFNYAVFEEELEYEYPFGAGPQVTYPPR